MNLETDWNVLERRLIMVKFIAGTVVAALALVFNASPVSAQAKLQSCGLSGEPSCLTLAQVGPGQRQQLLLGTRPTPNARKPVGPLNTLNDLWAALEACWVPPPLENAQPGMQMTLRFSFNRDGGLIGPPQLTYATPEMSMKTRYIYREALAQSLRNCTPLQFTSGLGGAIAGRPISVLISDIPTRDSPKRDSPRA
jgi:hypothetical protein